MSLVTGHVVLERGEDVLETVTNRAYCGSPDMSAVLPGWMSLQFRSFACIILTTLRGTVASVSRLAETPEARLADNTRDPGIRWAQRTNMTTSLKQCLLLAAITKTLNPSRLKALL